MQIKMEKIKNRKKKITENLIKKKNTAFKLVK